MVKTTVTVMSVALTVLMCLPGLLGVIAENNPACSGRATHAQIQISGDADLLNKATAEGWQGDGTAGNPYIIENYEINSPGAGYCIRIIGTSKYIIIRNCTLTNATGTANQYDGRNAACDIYQSSNIVVENVTVSVTSHWWSGVNIRRGSSSVKVFNSTISSCSDAGIYLEQASYIQVAGCKLFANQIGLSAYSTNNFNVTGNNISSNQNGIRTSQCTYGTIVNNTVRYNSWAGITLDWGNNDFHNISYNQLSNNWGPGLYAFYDWDVPDYNLISYNNISNNNDAGVMFQSMMPMFQPTGNKFLFNNVSSNAWAGLYIRELRDTELRNNTIQKNAYFGVYMPRPYGTAVVSGNDISYNSQNGLHTYSCSNAIFEYNTFNQNNGNGLYFASYCSNNRVSQNRFINNPGVGVYLDYQSNSNLVYNNSIVNNTVGLQTAQSSNGNLIYNNTVSGNQRGMRIISNSNTIYNNNFFSNSGGQAYDEGATNSWNTTWPTGGNYWDDYRWAGSDFYSGPSQNVPGSDGFGEVPYDLEPTQIHRDRLPLTAPAANDLPNSTLSPTERYWYSGPARINATAQDKRDGIGSVSLYYSVSTDNSTWGQYRKFATDAATPWGWLFNFPDGEGHYRFFSLAQDAIGSPERPKNVSEAKCAFDNTVPLINITAPVSGQNVTYTSQALKWTGTDALSGMEHYEFRLDGGDWTSLGTATDTLLSGLMDGPHGAAVRAFDQAGNSQLANVGFFVDANAPELTITSPANGSILPSKALTVEWSGADYGIGLDRYETKLDALAPVVAGTNTSAAYINLSEGNHVVTVSAYDLFGNSNTRTVSFTVDTVSPNLTITAPAPGELLNVSSVTLKWTGTDITTGYELVIDGLPVFSVGDVNLYLLRNLPEGVHTASVKTSDRAGNSAVASVSFTTDTVAPELVIRTPTDRTLTASPNLTLTWNGTDAGTGISGYSVRLDGGAWRAAELNTTYAFGTLPDGTHSLEVSATDRAGNSRTARIGITVDATAPSVTITSPVANETIRTGDISAFWNGSDAVSGLLGYSIRLDGGAPLQTGTGTLANFRNLQDGNHTIEVVATDIAGNSRTAGVSFVIDTKPQGPFDTTAPTVKSIVPSGLKIPLNIQVVVTFSEPMDAKTLTFTCSPDPLGWTVMWGPDRMQAYLLHTDFRQKTAYTFTVTGGKDLAGNGINGTTQTTFTTLSVTAPVQKTGQYDSSILIGPIILIVVLGALVGYLLMKNKPAAQPFPEMPVEETPRAPAPRKPKAPAPAPDTGPRAGTAPLPVAPPDDDFKP